MRLKADCQLTTVINMNLNFLLKDDPSTFLSLPHLLWPHPLVQSMVGAVFIYLYISHIQWKTLPQVQRHKLSLMNIFISSEGALYVIVPYDYPSAQHHTSYLSTPPPPPPPLFSNRRTFLNRVRGRDTRF